MELIVSLFILTIGILFVFNLILQPYSFYKAPELKSIALYLAEEGLDLVENVRYGNYIQDIYSSVEGYDNGLNNCGSGCRIDYTMLQDQNPVLPMSGLNDCLNLDSNGFYSYQPGTSTSFSRKIEISVDEDTDTMTVTSTVSYSWKGTSRVVSVQRKLRNYLQW